MTNVAVRALRAELSSWIARARDGEDVVVTERGVPVARLLPIGVASALERLESSGVINRPTSRTRPVASTTRRVRASGAVADLIGEQRR